MEVIGILDYLVGFAIMAGIYSVFSLGLNVHWGFTGLFNIGIAGFFCAGRLRIGAVDHLVARPDAVRGLQVRRQLVQSELSGLGHRRLVRLWTGGSSIVLRSGSSKSSPIATKPLRCQQSWIVRLSPYLIVRFKPRKRSLTEVIWWCRLT